MEEKNIVEWLNKKIASLQESHVQDDVDPDTLSEGDLQRQRDARIKRIKSIDAAFEKFPTLEKVCKDWSNNVIDSCFTTFVFEEPSLDTEEFNIRENYFMNFANLAGRNLRHIDLSEEYASSGIMQCIKTDCQNLKSLCLAFYEVKSEDFENFFSNMSYLKSLVIKWDCEDSTLPETLVKSLEQVGGTLEYFEVQSYSDEIHLCLPYSLASVFPRLIALESLCIEGFQIVQPLFQSIGEMKNLEKLSLECDFLNTFEYVYPIGLFKNLTSLSITNYDYITNEFLVYLCNNAQKIIYLTIGGTNITDDGIIALNNLEQLEQFNINLWGSTVKKMKFITNESIQCLFNKNLRSLWLSNCIKITNISVIKLLENLPNLDTLYVQNTKVTYDVVEEISKSSKYREKELKIYVSFEDREGRFPIIKTSHNIVFRDKLYL
ncbi:uncharacterized protein LOC122859182 [Aphidius gifuensis]|uniref:uncharacterized protein LOC122859182 n=1 Tax=Aphidius gifuensis TaxID=684658 RepID=UPI001CDBC7DD|nr:uncharacterized protein LOC122859182 [Aphidius gifuensis]